MKGKVCVNIIFNRIYNENVNEKDRYLLHKWLFCEDELLCVYNFNARRLFREDKLLCV